MPAFISPTGWTGKDPLIQRFDRKCQNLYDRLGQMRHHSDKKIVVYASALAGYLLLVPHVLSGIVLAIQEERSTTAKKAIQPLKTQLLEIEQLMSGGKVEEAQPKIAEALNFFGKILISSKGDQLTYALRRLFVLTDEVRNYPKQYHFKPEELDGFCSKLVEFIKQNKWIYTEDHSLLKYPCYLATLFQMGQILRNTKSENEFMLALQKLAKTLPYQLFLNKYKFPSVLLSFLRIYTKKSIYLKANLKSIFLTPLSLAFSLVLFLPVYLRGWYNGRQSVRFMNHGCQIVNDMIFAHLDRIFSSSSLSTLTRALAEYLVEDKNMPNFYAVLALSLLAKFRLPMIELAVGGILPAPNDAQINLAVMGPLGEDNIALLLEAAHHPDSYPFLVLSPTWLRHHISKRRVDALQGILARDGRLIFGRFPHPVSVDYANKYYDCSFNQELALRAAKTPKSGDIFMTRFTEEKDVMNLIMQQAGLNVSQWCSLVVSSNKFNKQAKLHGGTDMHSLKSKPSSEEIRDILYSLLHSNDENRSEIEIVIKPTTGSCGRDVSFFILRAEKGKTSDDMRAYRENLIPVIKAVQKIIAQKENVIIQRRVIAPELIIESRKYDSNLRVFVSRNQNDEPEISAIAVRIDDKGGPVNISLTASILTFDKYCEYLGINGAEKEKLVASITQQALGAFKVVHDRVKDFNRKPHRIDFAGVDIILEKTESGELIPHIMEINDYHSGGMWDLDDVAPPEQKGDSSRLFVETMIRRGKEYREKRKN